MTGASISLHRDTALIIRTTAWGYEIRTLRTLRSSLIANAKKSMLILFPAWHPASITRRREEKKRNTAIKESLYAALGKEEESRGIHYPGYWRAKRRENERRYSLRKAEEKKRQRNVKNTPFSLRTHEGEKTKKPLDKHGIGIQENTDLSTFFGISTCLPKSQFAVKMLYYFEKGVETHTMTAIFFGPSGTPR